MGFSALDTKPLAIPKIFSLFNELGSLQSKVAFCLKCIIFTSSSKMLCLILFFHRCVHELGRSCRNRSLLAQLRALTEWLLKKRSVLSSCLPTGSLLVEIHNSLVTALVDNDT